MQNKYYYLVASLSSLQFAGEAPISFHVFLNECGKWLTPGDMEVILAANIKCVPGKCDHTELLAGWKSFEGEVREHLAQAREDRKNKEEFRGEDRIKEIMDQETPLEMEKALERIRWDYLEELAHEHYFDLDWLIIYSLQLQILERLASFNKDEGERYFYELCEVDYEKAIG